MLSHPEISAHDRDMLKQMGLPLAHLDHIQADDFGYCVENGQVIALSLRKCQIEPLPESIWSLTNLQTLILGENPLTELSERIGELKRLTGLYLYNTQVITL